jgi:hypothetical protein
MSNLQENRVLGRAGARPVSEEELEKITGGFQTGVCTFDTVKCVYLDGDCSKNPPPCLGQ